MFERITPEEAGVSSAKIAEYLSMLKRRHSQMHSVLMMRGDKLFAEYYWAPFDKDFCHRMYSVTKSFTSVAIGLLVEEGKLSLDDSLKAFEEGIALVRFCNGRLDAAEQRIRILVSGEDGSVSEQPFRPTGA